MSDSNQIQKRHYDGIDTLRMVGCIAIIAMHIRANTSYTMTGFGYDRLIPSWTTFVYMFLIISGFSMCCGYYRSFCEGNVSLEHFYLKRYKKIVPFFALLVVIDILMERTAESVYEGFAELTMVFGLLPNNQLSVIGVSWTLGVIFLFYMLFPYFVFLLKNRRRAWVAFICSIILNVLCAVYFFSEKFVIENFAPRHSFLYCTPFFLSGGLIYLYREEICRVVQRFRWMFLAGCCVLTCLYYVLPDVAYSVDCTAWKVLVVYSAWICYAISIDSRLLCNAVSKFMGKISFEMYLAQMLVFRLVEKLGIVKAFGDSWIGFFGIWLLVLAGLTAFVELYRWLIKILELRYEHKRQQEKY